MTQMTFGNIKIEQAQKCTQASKVCLLS